MTAVTGLPAAAVLIGGEEVAAPTAPVINPARTSEVVGEHALGGERHVDSAVRAAAKAFPAWSARPAGERAEYLLRAADELAAHVPAWANLLTREVGKVLPESRGDAAGAVALTRYFASLAADVDTERPVALPLPGTAVLRHVPSGPVGVSLPFGGFRQSGVGRNHGLESVLACMEMQAIAQFDDPGSLPGTDHRNTLLKGASA